MTFQSVRLQLRKDVVDGRRNLVLLVGLLVQCITGKTNSIHLAPERIDDYTDSLVAGNRVVRVADVEFDCHGDLALIAREIPAVEGNMCGLHRWCFIVGHAVCFVVGIFSHDEMIWGKVSGFCARNTDLLRGDSFIERRIELALLGIYGWIRGHSARYDIEEWDGGLLRRQARQFKRGNDISDDSKHQLTQR